jgi:UDP-N-acetylenolpyruvoylglucosamine reductase
MITINFMKKKDKIVLTIGVGSNIVVITKKRLISAMISLFMELRKIKVKKEEPISD